MLDLLEHLSAVAELCNYMDVVFVSVGAVVPNDIWVIERLQILELLL